MRIRIIHFNFTETVDSIRSNLPSFNYRFVFYSSDVSNISTPIPIKIIPPIRSAFFNSDPNFLPSSTPDRQIMKVIAAIISAQTNAIIGGYCSIVKPTDRASIEVATP